MLSKISHYLFAAYVHLLYVLGVMHFDHLLYIRLGEIWSSLEMPCHALTATAIIKMGGGGEGRIWKKKKGFLKNIIIISWWSIIPDFFNTILFHFF